MKIKFSVLLILFIICTSCGSSSTSSNAGSGGDATEDSEEDEGNTEVQGGTVTISGTLALASANIAKGTAKAADTESYIIHVLNAETGGQKAVAVDSNGAFEFSAAADSNYIVNILDSDKLYIGTLIVGSAGANKLYEAFTTGSDESTTDLGTVTVDADTGNVTTSNTTITADDGHVAYASGNDFAGENTGEGEDDYSDDVGAVCTENAIDCPDFDHDGVPDIFDTDNNNNGYADEVDGDFDLCVPGTVSLYIENYPTSGADQMGFPTPDEVSANLADTTMYQIRLEFAPSGDYTINDISEISVSAPAYIDTYGYVYYVSDDHECFNTPWTDCNSKKLLISDDGTKYEVGLADAAGIQLNPKRAGILENMFSGDTFILYITTADNIQHVCTRKINIIPKYYPYNFKKDNIWVNNSGTQTSWNGALNLSWEIPSTVGPAGMTYTVRITPHTACGSWDATDYTEYSAGQDATSIAIDSGALPTSAVNKWNLHLMTTDAAGDVSQAGPLTFTTAGVDQCQQ